MFDTLIKTSYPQALSRMVGLCGDIIELAIQEVLLLAPQLKHYRHYYSCLRGLFFEQGNHPLALEFYRQCLVFTTEEAQK